jgi:hypothetical protein
MYAQLRFRRCDSGTNEREHLGNRHPRSARDIDGAQDATTGRMVDRCSRAAPFVDGSAEVLRSEYLHTVIDGESGSGSIGPFALLAPVDALRKTHRTGTVLRCGIALDPQEAAFGVGNRDEQTGVGCILDEQLADDRPDDRHRMAVAVSIEFGAREDYRVVAAVRIDALCSATQPRIEDHGADTVGWRPVLDERPMRGRHPSSKDIEVLTRANSDPRVALPPDVSSHQFATSSGAVTLL